MSFDTLVDVDGYNLIHQKQSLNYVSIITKQYENPDFGIDFYALNTALGEASISKRHELLSAITSSSAYKEFDTARRSLMAMQSAVNSNFYYLYGQRERPKKGEGSSPLEDQNYVIKKMATSKTYYEEHLKEASPTSILRDLVQMKLYDAMSDQQKEQDQQRILAVLTMQLKIALQKQKEVVVVQSAGVNSIIKNKLTEESIQ